MIQQYGTRQPCQEVLLDGSGPGEGSIVCRERLGGLLKYYYREAA